MKNIKKLLVFTLILGFTISLTSCASNKGYKKGKRKRGKKGCNCPTFSADAINQTITWKMAKDIEYS